MKNFIKPECMPYYYDNGEKISKNVTQSIAYTADGFLLPCCWCDAPSTRKDIEKLGFYNNTLALKNNDSVNDILYSEVFGNFIKTITHNFEDAPRCCKEKCGKVYE